MNTGDVPDTSVDGTHTGPRRFIAAWSLDDIKSFVLRKRADFGVYVALAGLWIAFAIGSPYFLTPRFITDLLLIAATLALISAGLTIAMIAGEIDLSIGAMQAFAGTVAGLLMHHGLPWPLAVLIAMLAGTTAGAISGFVTAVIGLPSFIATLAMLGVVQGAALIMTDGLPLAGLPDAFGFLATGTVGPVPFVLLIVGAIYVVLQFILRRTVLGLHIFSVGGNRAAAAAVGINVRRTVIVVLTTSALLSSIAGILISSRLGAAGGNYGAEDLLPAVAAVIIGGVALTGGVGSLIGTLGGVLVIVTIDNGLVLLNVGQFWKQVVVGAILLAVVGVEHMTRRYTRSRA